MIRIKVNGEVVELEKARVVVGSSKDLSDVVVEDATVTRAHLAVEERDGALHLTDLGSDNGLWLDTSDGQELTKMPVRFETLRCTHGCTLYVGSVFLEVARVDGSG